MSQHSITIDQQNSDEVLIHNSRPALVDFWAPWCGPCKAIGPVIEELAEEYHGRVTIGKCNIDTTPELAQQYRVRSVPTLLFIQKGEIVDSITGVTNKSEIEKTLNKILSGEKIVRPLSMY